jgi:ribosomal protein S18 acetylase RimI-like enzyme
MQTIGVTTLEHIQLDQMVETWNRCWQGYYYDMAYTFEHMKFWLELGQVNLQNSVAIYAQDQVIGFALLAINNSEGWIAGTCIDPKYRGRGLFAPLMRSQLETAEHIGLKRVFLEVLVQNYAQIVYKSVGFVPIRQLQTYRTNSNIPVQLSKLNTFKQIDLPRYFESRKQAFFNPAWQRRPSYLERYGNTAAFVNSSGTAGILVAKKRNAPLLDIWSGTASGAEEIISMVLRFRKEGFSLINQPEDWIVSVLQENGIYPNASQYEMCIELT